MTKLEKVMLEVKDIMNLMGICKPKAYEILRSDQFHVVKMGRKYMVHKDVFENWLKGESKPKKRW
ncbi:DNA topoisomerase IB [Neobacillus niacini]|uniref:helix-turn-helix domain-containing protein n=1 Tax=Neobacillus driksii TaxID=3035913 RepID=UPI002789897D|nr:helix-turn-helix domain-containing protein [Neobacillus niacini]MDQ0975917.1 DNA topoisomerase IB [Neobacillus niacini]